MGLGLDLSGLRKDGSQFPVDVTLSPIDNTTWDVMVTIATIPTKSRAGGAASQRGETAHAVRDPACGHLLPRQGRQDQPK